MQILFTSVRTLITLPLVFSLSCEAQQAKPTDAATLPAHKTTVDLTQYNLVFEENFDGSEADFDARWEAQNGPNGHILCSRWRENVSVKDGFLRLTNKKESRGGQDWTSGSVWTKEQFTYGYFECRYRYAAAPATNNSFWLMTRGPSPKKGKRFEIDINEGHYPSEINTNIHNWSDITIINGKKTHPSSAKAFPYGISQDRVIQLEIPVTTQKIRLSSKQKDRFNISQFQIFNVNEAGYPDILKSGDRRPGLIDFVKEQGTKITTGNVKWSVKKNLTDGNHKTSWAAAAGGGQWIEFEFPEPKTIGCVQFANGWPGDHGLGAYLTDYTVQYEKNGNWIDMSTFNLQEGDHDFARDFHTYACEWNEDEIIFYFNGEELRREKNEFSHGPSPVWLSLAIIPWAGDVTDQLDGTFMEIDYVRVYQQKAKDAQKKERKPQTKNLIETPSANFRNADKWQIHGTATAVPDTSALSVTPVQPGSEKVLVNVLKKGERGPYLQTSEDYGDCEVDIDFMIPKGSNSGLYLMGRYEIQIFDSHRKENPTFSDLGAIYQRWNYDEPDKEKRGYEGHPPRVNAANKPGEWQNIKIRFQAPHFDAEGKKTQNARFLSVHVNGQITQENVEVTGPTRAHIVRGNAPMEVAKGPLAIQGDHGPIAIRNLVVTPLKD